MAISNVGLGWSVAERHFATLADWITAKGTSGVYEEAACKGDLGAAFASIGSTHFTQGALIRGTVAYTGANHLQLAKLSRKFDIASSSALCVVQDLHITHSASGQPSLNVTAGNKALRCYVEHTGDPGSNSAALMVSANAIAERCVAKAISTASRAIRPSGSRGIVRNCVAIGGNLGIYSEWTPSEVKFCYAALATTSCYSWPNGRPALNEKNASSDATGDVGYTNVSALATFVDSANADYRIRSSSPLAALGIGAFFEPSMQISDAIIDVTASVVSAVSASKISHGAVDTAATMELALPTMKVTSAGVDVTATAFLQTAAQKNSLASVQLSAGADVSINASKVGSVSVSMPVSVDVSVYSGALVSTFATISIHMGVGITLETHKEGVQPLAFETVCQTDVIGSKQATGAIVTMHAVNVQVNSQKCGVGLIQSEAQGLIDLDAVKLGSSHIVTLSSVSLTLTGFNASAKPLAARVYIQSKSTFKHPLNTRSDFTQSVHSYSQYNHALEGRS